MEVQPKQAEKRIAEALSRISSAADFRRIASETLRGEGDVVVPGLAGSARALFIARLWQTLRRPVIVIVAQDNAIASLAADIEYFHRTLNSPAAAQVCSLPGLETDPYSGLMPHAGILQTRATTLWCLRQKRADIVVTSIRAASTRLTAPSTFDTYSLHVTKGDEFSRELLVEHLTVAGYLRQEPVGGPGEFSVRGGIVDVYSPLMRSPVRMEFFGDTVDSIREFDLDDQRSRSPIQHIDILPMQDFLAGREMIRQWGDKALQHWQDDVFQKELAERRVFAEAGELFSGATFLLPLAFPLESTIFDYAEGAVLALGESEVLQETHARFLETLQQRYEQTASAGGLALPPSSLFWSPEDFARSKLQNPRFHLDELGTADFPNAVSFPVRSQPSARWHGRIKALAAEVLSSFSNGTQVVLLGSTLGMAERLRDFLHEYDIPFRLEFGDQPLKAVDDPVAHLVGIGRLSAGLSLPDAGLLIYSETDVFDEVEHAQPAHRRRQKLSAFISDLQDLKPGDYVVHVDHGIGTYSGITLVHDRECMVLLYYGGDRIYVPLERLDLIQKYSSTEGAKPQLDKLGGTSWIQRKARVKRAIRDMAQELLQLYAQRKLAQGYAFSPDSEWQKEFEEAFPYDETPDQITAIADIKRDMESPVPMDRLICGDVGYGKTEVAMRAAFKAIGDGKQVAVLAPTTVLCFQHFETFKERFSAFPVKIAMLSRFVPPKEQKVVVADTEAGRVDVVIGTHRLLSNDVKFQDASQTIRISCRTKSG